MKIIADTHTHTLVSGHAFSTLHENAIAAARAGLKYLVSTEHTGQMPGSPINIFFQNKEAFPKVLEGVTLVFGCEVNIIDFHGSLDLPKAILTELDWVIASMHIQVLVPGSVKEHTEAWIEIAKNSDVDVIGHCGNEVYHFEYETVIKEFARNGKIVEINTHSFSARPGSLENCTEIARLCKKYSVPVVVCSDAHSEVSIGNFETGIQLLEKIHFPKELILNADVERFEKTLQDKIG
jgi:putative hydrolase